MSVRPLGPRPRVSVSAGRGGSDTARLRQERATVPRCHAATTARRQDRAAAHSMGGSRGRGMVDDGALGVPEGRAWLARRNSHRAALSHTPIVNGGAAGSRVWWCTMMVVVVSGGRFFYGSSFMGPLKICPQICLVKKSRVNCDRMSVDFH